MRDWLEGTVFLQGKRMIPAFSLQRFAGKALPQLEIASILKKTPARGTHEADGRPGRLSYRLYGQRRRGSS